MEIFLPGCFETAVAFEDPPSGETFLVFYGGETAAENLPPMKMLTGWGRTYEPGWKRALMGIAHIRPYEYFIENVVAILVPIVFRAI